MNLSLLGQDLGGRGTPKECPSKIRHKCIEGVGAGGSASPGRDSFFLVPQNLQNRFKK